MLGTAESVGGRQQGAGFRSGAGGVDAADWAQMLMRMYIRWAEKHGYPVEVFDTSYAEEAGIKSAALRLTGPLAYGYAKAEKGVLDGVALGLPALTRAVKLQNRAARVGFDWPGPAEVLDKIREEAAELAEAREGADQGHVTEEFGDLLFVMANLARHLKIDPEEALRGANAKFTRRFQSIEATLASQGRRPEDSTLEEMDALWDAAKAAERA